MRHLCILPNAGVPICYQAEVAALQQELSDLRAQYQSLEQVHTQLLDAEGDDDDIHFEQTYEDEEE